MKFRRKNKPAQCPDDLEPTEVFTPNKPQILLDDTQRSGCNYIDRDIQDKLAEAISEGGAQILIYGESGVGKSSLVGNFKQKKRYDGIPIQCKMNETYDELLCRILVSLGDRKDIGIISEQRESKGIQLGPSFVKGIYEKENDSFNQSIPFTSKNYEDRIKNNFIQENLQFLIIDDFEKININERKRFIDLLKIFSDATLSCVIIGAIKHIDEFVTTDFSLERRLHTLQIPRMSDNEIRSLLYNGFSLLHLDADPQVVDRIVTICSGYPTFAHRFGLELSRHAFQINRSINLRDLKDVQEKIASKFSGKYYEYYKKAIRTRKGSLGIHKKVVDTLAIDERDKYSIEDIELLLKREGITRKQLYQPLNELTTFNRGGILRKDKEDGTTFFRFDSYFLKIYIRNKIYLNNN